jgi:hypothetical protein
MEETSDAVDPFEGSLKQAFEDAGKRAIVPHLTCVREAAPGEYRAYFGYESENALSVNIPHSKRRNDFPADVEGDRPEIFAPGLHPWAFGVSFQGKERLRYELKPEYGRATTVRASRQSPECLADDPSLTCAKECEASFAAPCPDQSVGFEQCVSECKGASELFAGACEPEWNGYLECIAAVPPDPENWVCIPDFVPQIASPLCETELLDALICAGF